MSTPEPASESPDAVIVGAGIAGMYAVHALRQRGLSAIVFERGSDVGGTWYWNRYPGARCDQESVYYSYSFDSQLEQDWEWTERYPTQPELLSYLNHVAERFNIRDNVTFDTAVVAADYDETSHRWCVQTDTALKVYCQFLIMATGCLSEPIIPALAGLDSFEGRVLLTARWPHEKVDFTDQRVAVIGTGSSGIQAIPLIAAQAERLTVFQRTASFSLPAKNAPLEADAAREVKANYRDIRMKMRTSAFGSPRIIEPTQSALDVSAAERDATYEAAFEFGHLGAMLQTYNDLLTNQQANDTAADFVRSKIRQVVTDEMTADRLMPRGYPIGAKRPCLDTNYYATYNRSNVELVSVAETPIVEIAARSIRTSRNDFSVDSIVLATGFDAITGALLKNSIRGCSGSTMKEKWKGGATAYLGVATAGFPNLFMITGPGSPSVLSNMVVSIEQHVEWIADCIAHMRQHGYVSIAPLAHAESEWMARVQTLAESSLFLKAHSWYQGANIAGKARIFLPFIGGVGNFRRICDDIAADGYRGFVLE